MAVEGPMWPLPCIWFPYENVLRSKQPIYYEVTFLAIAVENYVI